MFSLKKKTKTNPCLPHGIYIFLILKKKTIFCSLASHEKNYFFFLFFSQFQRWQKKLRNLNRLAWQKCLFHQFSSHKHKRENILDQTIKKNPLLAPQGFHRTLTMTAVIFVSLALTALIQFLFYAIILYKCNFFLLVYLSVLIMSSGLLLHPKFILPYLYFNHLTC